MTRPYRIGCHCGAIRLEVDAELTGLVECNCSTCARSGFVSWYVPPDAVRLLDEGIQLSTYVWRYATEGMHFCRICGIAVIRTWTRDARVSVNARCLEGVDVFELEIRRYDGRNEMPPGPLPPRE